MTTRTGRIEGIALVANLDAADLVAASIPGANHDKLFTTGVPLKIKGGDSVCVARLVSIPSHPAAINTAQEMVAVGIPACIHAVRILPTPVDDTIGEWVDSLGFETMPRIWDHS